MELFLRDLRFALRGLRKTPMFTTIAIASLALGIGANTAIFSLFDQVLIRSLGVKEPDRLAWFKQGRPNMGFMSGPNTFSYPMYRDLATRNTVFEGVLGRFPTALSMAAGGQTERVEAELVTGNFFEVLGLNAYMGRLITPDDDRTPGGHPVVVLSHGFWMRRFGGKADLLNKTIALNDTPMTVIGIAPPGFHGVETGRTADVFVPSMMKAQMTPTWNELFNRRAMWLRVLGRLKPGVTREQAEAAMNALWRPILADELKEMPAMSERFRKEFSAKHLTLAPGNQGVMTIQDTFSRPLQILMTMVGLVLLIACANVANLLMARGAARQQDMAIRAALGAGRWRLMRQLIGESILLSAAGGVLGIVVSSWFTAGLIHLLPANDGLVRSLSTTPDVRVLAFTFSVSMLTGLVFGIFPAWQSTRVSVAGALKDNAIAVVGNSAVQWRRWLVAAQVSMSLVLLIAASLFVRTLVNLTSQNTGFRSANVLTFSLDPKLSGYSQQRSLDFFDSLRERAAALPGVQAVSMAEVPIVNGRGMVMSTIIEGYRAKEDEIINPDVNWVGPGFFNTLGVRLMEGRDFEERDRTAKVAVINEQMARTYFGTSSPLDRRLTLGRSGPYRIVGVAANFKDANLRDKATPLQVYVPFGTDTELDAMTFYVRAGQDPGSLMRGVRGLVQDSQLPIFNVKTLETQIADNVYVDRIIAALSAAFGVLATLLAGVGLYGVIAYVVLRRTREIGIRMALGAAWTEVLRLVLHEVVTTVGVGIGVAVIASLGLSKLVESQLYGVSARDPLAIAAGVVAMTLVILLAAVGPAIRALRIEPMRALRYE